MKQEAVRISQLSFVEVLSGYKDIFRRTYTINNLNTRSVDKIQSAFQEGFSTGGTVTPGFIARELGDVMGLTRMPGGRIDIPNGWREERLRFVMIVEVDSFSNVKKRYIIQGFTDYLGATQRHLDLNMKMYVNSITEAMVRVDPYTNEERISLGNSYNTLKDLSDASSLTDNLYPDSKLTLLRPYDLNIAESLSMAYSYDNGEPFTVSSVLNVGEYSRNTSDSSFRMNSNSDIYFSRLLNSYNVGKNISATNFDSPGESERVFMSAAEHVLEPKLTKNAFISRLQMVTGRIAPSDFTYGELINLDPNVDNIKNIFISGADSYGYKINPATEIGLENCSETVQPTMINMKVLELNSSITGMLATCGLSEAYIVIRTGLGPYDSVVAVTHGLSLLGQSAIQPGVNKLEQNILHTILPKLLLGLEMELEITINCDILKDTTIIIRYPMGETEVFKFPTFADSLYNPAIGTEQQKNTLRQDLRTIYEDFMPSSRVY